MARRHRSSCDRRGSSTLSLTVVVMCIGTLTSLGLPRWYRACERALAREAVDYLRVVSAAQSEYLDACGNYSSNLQELDLGVVAPAYFSVGLVGCRHDGEQPSWSLTLTRCGLANIYGPYTITCTEQGFDRQRSSIDPAILTIR